MKLKNYYLLSIIVIILNVMFFDISFIDNPPETKIEVLLETDKESSDKLIGNTAKFYVNNETKLTLFYFSTFRINKLYLSNIFKPPISLYT